MLSQNIEKYDDYRNLLEAKSESFYGHAWINSWSKGDVTYDEEFGYPLKYLRSDFTPYNNSTTGEWDDIYSFVYSDYYNPASILSTDFEGDSQTRYYSIDGRPVNAASPAPGIYIRITGNRTEKVIIK